MVIGHQGHSAAGRNKLMEIPNCKSGIEHATFRLVALPRTSLEFLNILLTIPSYTTQFALKYKCVVYDGMLNKYIY